VTEDLIAKIKDTIKRIRPYLQRDGGDVEFIRFEEGIVYVKLSGACVGCSFIDYTLRDGLEQVLIEEVPGVIGVEQVEE
jgi:Fe-S cluster biogenesis protein NfuA